MTASDSSAVTVSVIIPVHNVAPYLDACVGSVLKQRETSLEVILIDDGSTDGSERLCDDWADRDPRVRTFHKPGRGSSVARNTGIDQARGAFLTFVDADDVVSPDLVSELLRLATEAGADIVLAEFAAFTGPAEAAFTDLSTADPKVTVSSADEALYTVICGRPHWGPFARLFRRDLFDAETRFPPGLLHQDLALTPRVFHRASICARTDAVLYAYRERPGSVTDRTKRVASPDLITILRGNIEFSRRTQPPERFREYLATYLRHAARQVERIEGPDAWQRNAAFIAAYQGLARDYWREHLGARSAPAVARLILPIAVMSPRAFRSTSLLGRAVLCRVRTGTEAARSCRPGRARPAA